MGPGAARRAGMDDDPLSPEDLQAVALEDLFAPQLPRTGRAAAPLGLIYIRDLTADDIKLACETPLGTQAPALAKIRARHHSLAKLVAEGRSGAEIAALTGYTASRVSILTSDPTFGELVAYYQSMGAEIYADVHKQLALLGMTAIEELQERLEEAPASLTTREVRELGEFALDRSIAPKAGAAGASVGPGAGSPVTVNIKFQGTDRGQPAPLIDITPQDDDDN